VDGETATEIIRSENGTGQNEATLKVFCLDKKRSGLLLTLDVLLIVHDFEMIIREG